MKQVETSEGIDGLAKIEIHPNQPKVKVTLKPAEDGQKPKVYILDKEKCPDSVKNGIFLVRLSGNGEKMYSIRPQSGVFKAKVLEFAAQTDQQTGKKKEPTPKTHNGKFGAYQTFTVAFQITEGEMEGLQVPGSFPYDFVAAEEDVPGKGVVEVIGLKKKKDSKYNQKLVELLEVTRVIKAVLPWKENVLPTLQRAMLKNDRTFSVSVKDGWVDGLFAEADESDFA